MARFNVSDDLAFDLKALRAGNAALGLWVRAGSWSACYETDGFIPRKLARRLASKRHADSLVSAGLWEAEVGGYRFTSWAEQQRDSRNASPSVRALVIARDGLTCRLCGSPVEPDDVHLDHIVPWSLGGRTTVDNLRVTHSACNMKRGRR